MRWQFRLTLYTLAILLVLGLFPGVVLGKSSDQPLKIGVLMDLQGPLYLQPEYVLDWGAGLVNASGGINGRRLELVYRDTSKSDALEAARQFLDDENVKAVIGPVTSDEALRLAPRFIQKKKLLISPTATSADLSRAFAGKGFFWRTAPGDIEQTRTILRLLKERGAVTLSLIYQESAYGKTFLEWLPFFSSEMGMRVLNIVPYQSGDPGLTVDKSLAGNPDYVVAATFSEETDPLKRAWDMRQPASRLFLTDGSQTDFLIQMLGDAAEGLEGVSPACDPGSGFEKAYFDQFGRQPLNYAAAIWDSFLLAAYTLARNEYRAGTEWMEDSLETVIAGRGSPVRWNELSRGLRLISAGDRPNIEGASSSLEFDSKNGVGPSRSYYARWVVEDGQFRTLTTISSSGMGGSSDVTDKSEAGYKASSWLKSYSLLPAQGNYAPGQRSGLWAVIISSSEGWDDYRHQSDALAVYDMLRRNGVSDNRIILFDVDDIPADTQNPLPGVVRHEVGGKNNRTGARIDYSGKQVTSRNLLDVLSGNGNSALRYVLESNSGSDVLLYLVGHGLQGAVQFDNGPRLTKTQLAEAVRTMQERGMFRQMLIMTELCFGASMGEEIDTPGVLYFTASDAKEQSFGANFDAEAGAWLADDFTHQTLKVLENQSTRYLTDLYSEVYARVSGSHAQLLNYENFGDIRGALVSDFFEP